MTAAPLGEDDDDGHVDAGGGVGGGVGAALRALLRSIDHLPPDELASLTDVVVEQVRWVDSVDLYLVDHDQTVLRRVAVHRPSTARDEHDVAADGPGSVLRTQAPWWEPGAGAAALWVPITARWSRLGVARLCLAGAVDPEALPQRAAGGMAIGAALAQVLEQADAYTDVLRVCRRRKGLTLSAELQWELLPPLTLELPEVSVAGVLEPAYEVGGDCFDHSCNDGVLDLAVFDPVGHSLTSALVAALVLGAHRHARRAGLPLEQVGAAIDAAIATEFGHSTFVTGRLGRLDLATGVLRWVNAGHPPPLWWHQGALAPWPDRRPDLPFGLGHTSTVHEVQLAPGDRLLLHTDGVVDARDARGDVYGQDGLLERFVQQARAGTDLLAGVRGMVAAVLEHLAGEPLRDDATLLEVVWRGPTGRP